ncbi:MAG: hypothetical protein AAGD22_18285 [Verrucomicrobiota bacterium]
MTLLQSAAFIAILVTMLSSCVTNEPMPAASESQEETESDSSGEEEKAEKTPEELERERQLRRQRQMDTIRQVSRAARG